MWWAEREKLDEKWWTRKVQLLVRLWLCLKLRPSRDVARPTDRRNRSPPICLFHLPHFQIPFFISLYFDCTQRFSFSSTLDYVGCTSVLLLLYIVAAERSRSTFTITKGLEQEKIWAGYSKRLSSYNTHTHRHGNDSPQLFFFCFFF